MRATSLILLLFPFLTHAQRPSDRSICDYYASSLLGSNTASRELLLMTLLVNSFVIGNYTTPNVGLPCAGIAAPAVYNGTNVDLLPYFTGAYNSTNEGGNSGVAGVLFLDDGGATPLGKNLSSNGDVGTKQYALLTHIYQYFGTLLGCSKQGSSEFPSYQGRTSMYEIHQFMDFSYAQMSFFIATVKASALSLGFSTSDASSLASTLNTLFNTRCAPATAVPGINAPPQLQSCCIAPDCPLDPNGDCTQYPDDGVALIPVNVTAVVANGTATHSGGTATASPSAVRNGTVTTSLGVGGKEVFGLQMVGVVVGAIVLALSML